MKVLQVHALINIYYFYYSYIYMHPVEKLEKYLVEMVQDPGTIYCATRNKY